MNVHHLELFYYVARHGGISEAVRNIPYGIQQPAVSAQVAQLEEFLGGPLFTRRPFALTPRGEKLYRFIEPFFGGLDAMTEEMRGGGTPLLRIGSANIIVRDHLPEVLRAVRAEFPNLRVTVRSEYQPELESLLLRQEIDVIICLLEGKPSKGVQSVKLMELPMILLVPANSRLKKAEELWKLDKIEEPLICLPQTEVLPRIFQQGLAKLGVDWFSRLEINSTDSIEAYVAGGFGVGLMVAIPNAKPSPKIRALELPGFPPVTLAAMWCGKPSPPLRKLLDEIQAGARRMRTPLPSGEGGREVAG
jgi:DNA-binding transcriptional LysR family regulator